MFNGGFSTVQNICVASNTIKDEMKLQDTRILYFYAANHSTAKNEHLNWVHSEQDLLNSLHTNESVRKLAESVHNLFDSFGFISFKQTILFAYLLWTGIGLYLLRIHNCFQIYTWTFHAHHLKCLPAIQREIFLIDSFQILSILWTT